MEELKKSACFFMDKKTGKMPNNNVFELVFAKYIKT